MDYPQLKLFINGEWRTPQATLPVTNPATEEVIGAVPVATEQDLEDALAAAHAGFQIWSQTSPKHRSDLVRAAAALMRASRSNTASRIAKRSLK